MTNNIRNKWDVVYSDHIYMNNISQKYILDRIRLFNTSLIYDDIDIDNKIKNEFIEIIMKEDNDSQLKLESKISLLSKKYENNRIEYLYYRLLKFIRETIVTIGEIKYYISWIICTNKFILSGIQILDLLLIYNNIKEIDILSYIIIRYISNYKSLFGSKTIYKKLSLCNLFNNGFCITYNKPNYIIDDKVIDNIILNIERWNDILNFFVYKYEILESDYIFDDNINKIIIKNIDINNKKYTEDIFGDIIHDYINKPLLNSRLYKRYMEINKYDYNIEIVLNIFIRLLKYFNNYEKLDRYIFIITNNNKISNDFIKYHLNMINNVMILLLFEYKSPLILDILYNNDYKLLENILISINYKYTNDINYIINLYHIFYTNIIDGQQLLKTKYNHSNFINRIIQLSTIHEYFIKLFHIFCNYNKINYKKYLHLFYYHDMIFINHDPNNKIYNYYMEEYRKPIITERSKEVFKLITNQEFN